MHASFPETFVNFPCCKNILRTFSLSHEITLTPLTGAFCLGGASTNAVTDNALKSVSGSGGGILSVLGGSLPTVGSAICKPSNSANASIVYLPSAAPKAYSTESLDAWRPGVFKERNTAAACGICGADSEIVVTKAAFSSTKIARAAVAAIQKRKSMLVCAKADGQR